MKSKAIGCCLVLALSACDGGASPADDQGIDPSVQAGKSVHVALNAQETDAGKCKPVMVSTVNAEKTRLYMIRGEMVFAPKEGSGNGTEIPLQIQFSGYDADGIGRDKSITILNDDVGCAELDIHITVEHCEYFDGGGAEDPCPDIVVEGADRFANVQLLRSDLK